jgi:hypothetical protein
VIGLWRSLPKGVKINMIERILRSIDWGALNKEGVK